jgi:hypothetical protein
MILPSAVLAQVWRDGTRQATLSRMLRNPGLVEAPLHHADAERRIITVTTRVGLGEGAC